jgi:hypothetical protein
VAHCWYQNCTRAAVFLGMRKIWGPMEPFVRWFEEGAPPRRLR